MILGLGRFKVFGHSMQPTFRQGDQVIVWKFSKIKTGDVVAFKYNSKVLIKRVKTIQKQRYYLQGDNKEDSLDSRKLGLIEKHDIIGKVIYKL